MRALVENGKYCCYCEQKLGENSQIEHYRPEAIYTWLSTEPENLLSSCPKCNGIKNDNFAINNPIYTGTKTGLSSSTLDKLEEPLLVNPKKKEQAFFTKNIKFHSQDATIHSEDLRLHYTIGCCKLNREYLINERLKVINRIKNDLREIFYLKGSKGVHEYIQTIKREIDNNNLEFSAVYRYFLLKRSVFNNFISISLN